MTEVRIDSAEPAVRRLWLEVVELAERLPERWVLVGGLMVQLHAFEHAVRDVRSTRDIDVLGEPRPPGALRAIDRSGRLSLARP